MASPNNRSKYHCAWKVKVEMVTAMRIQYPKLGWVEQPLALKMAQAQEIQKKRRPMAMAGSKAAYYLG
jgi:hypothetical protein